MFEGLPGADGDGGAGQLQGVVEGVVDAGVEDFAEVVGEVLPAECGDDGGGDDGGGEDAPAIIKAEAALFFVPVVACAADDLPQGDEDEDDETGDGDVDKGELAFLQRLTTHRRLTEAVDAVQREQDEDSADEDDAGAACFALAADLVGCQGNGGGGVGQGQVSRHLGFQAGLSVAKRWKADDETVARSVMLLQTLFGRTFVRPVWVGISNSQAPSTTACRRQSTR